jgi:uncharacterized membrane protein (DUF373 family)
MHFFNKADDTPEKRISKVMGTVIVAILFSGVAGLMIYAAFQGFHWIG